MIFTQTTQIEWLYVITILIIGGFGLFMISRSIDIENTFYIVMITMITIMTIVLFIIGIFTAASMGVQNTYTSNLVEHKLKNDYAYNKSDNSAKFITIKTPNEYEFYEEDTLVYLKSGETVQLEIEYSKPKIDELIKQDFLRDAKIYIVKDNNKYFLPQKYYKEEDLVPLLKKAYEPIEELEKKKEGKKPFFSFAII